MAAITDLTDATFTDAINNASTPVLVDFWATWCGPCKAMAPHLDALSAELDGKVQIAKVNADENQGTAAQFGVRALPTLLMFKDGQPVDKLLGNKPKAAIQAFIEKHI